MTDVQNPLPAGWDSKVDKKTGKTFYINHYTRITTWDDPRSKNVPFTRQNTPLHMQYPSNEYVVTQHGSPDLRRNYVYPSQSSPIPAFQIPGQYSPIYIPLKDQKTNARMSPLLLKTSQTQDSSLTNVPDTEDSVAKISAMFPTVSDTHIRLLLKKYMKCIFPKAEEIVILDVLTNSDNNIQKASDWLKGMGYERRDPVKLQQQAEAKLEEERRKNEKLKAEVPPIPKIKTTEEKAAIKARLQEKYKDIIEQVITIALDSVQYDEERANQILQIMVQEDNKTQSSSSSKSEEPVTSTNQSEPDGLAPPENMPTSQSRQSFKSLLGSEKNENKDKGYFNRNGETEKDETFKSPLLMNTQGANPNIVKGANDKLLLMDYIPWQGTNVHIRNGPQKGLAKGPNKNNLSEKKYTPSGPNPQMCRGAKPGLAKGSIFQQFRHIVNSESRGK